MRFNRRVFCRLLLGGYAGLHTSVLRAAMSKSAQPAFDLGFVASGLHLVPRVDWQGRDARPLILRPSGGFDRITIHHSGSAGPDRTGLEDVRRVVLAIQADHMERQFGDLGYHFLLDLQGRVWEGRSLAYEGAHVLDQNANNIGIVLLGNFEEQEPVPEQIKTLAGLTGLLRAHFAVKPHRVYGHQDLGASACPGRHLYPYVESFRTGGMPDFAG